MRCDTQNTSNKINLFYDFIHDYKKKIKIVK